MLGSELIIRSLHRLGVKTLFSLSGNQIMPLYDACFDAGIRIIHVRHEAAAVFMADAWSQITGELGVAMLTAAPGIANGLAPLYSASQAKAQSWSSRVIPLSLKTARARFKSWTRSPSPPR
ncbi:thiamine pyrophosphate-binding protein [Achromobacter spanius]|uniref:thiamine pyrophosphate-binding protein n=1 Tax=Achromobacter spanius TaxID=217203 RepID=UPI003209436B